MSFVGECVYNGIFGMSQKILVKHLWQLPQGHPCLEVLLSQVENELFELPKADIK